MTVEIGDFIRVTRFFKEWKITPITGLVIRSHPLEPISDAHRKCFNIKVLETQGTICEIILNENDEVEIL